MKVGILTLPLHTNYGGILQAYALQTALRKAGHDARLIDQNPTPALPATPLSACRLGVRAARKYLLGKKNVHLFNEKRQANIYQIRSRFTRPFLHKYIDGLPIDSLQAVRKDTFDAIVVGSDQIWRPKYYANIEDAFLAFTQGWPLRRIAYAASFGTDEWPLSPKQTRNCAQLIREFDAVSVREDSAVHLCENFLGVRAEHVLDPTLLLSQQDYAFAPQADAHVLPEHYIATYFMDANEDKKAGAKLLADQTGMPVVPINNENTHKSSLPPEARIALPVEQWFHGLTRADLLLTDSFHGCAFAILFNRPFIAYGNAARGLTRFTSLLNMFGLQERLVKGTDELHQKTCWIDMDWTDVNARLQTLQKHSMAFLSEALKQ